ncbi:MAG TPA: class I SAM-dependent methyltransferase [Candidatus Paceibacterota bacterium]|nr:class I SAM-dependent methyltransferase [Candidatus Paceibacterota bacterium]
MSQQSAWEREYQHPQLVTKAEGPRSDLKAYLKRLRKTEGMRVEGWDILDLGSGTGRNANYLAEIPNRVIGLEFSPTAIRLAEARAEELGVSALAKYRLADIGARESFVPFPNNSFDLAIDIMSSNSLSEKERNIFLEEIHRVLKPGGYFFVRGLLKNGDKHVKNLLRENPGREHDTYHNKDMNLTERVFSRDDFVDLYSRYFEIRQFEKKTNYARFKGQSYKRKYFLAYLRNR